VNIRNYFQQFYVSFDRVATKQEKKISMLYRNSQSHNMQYEGPGGKATNIFQSILHHKNHIW